MLKLKMLNYFLIAHRNAVVGIFQKERPLSGALRKEVLTNCRVIGGRVVLSSHEGIWRQVSMRAVLQWWLIG